MMEPVTSPFEPAVDLEEARTLSVTLAALSNEQIKLEIEAAIATLDGPYGRLRSCMVTQTWRVSPRRVGSAYRLPDLGRDMAVTAAKPIQDGFDPATLQIARDTQGPFVITDRGLTSIDVSAGFGRAADVPMNIKRAIVILAEANALRSGEDGNLRSFGVDGAFSEAYNSPEMAMKSALATVDVLIRPYKRLVFA